MPKRILLAYNEWDASARALQFIRKCLRETQQYQALTVVGVIETAALGSWFTFQGAPEFDAEQLAGHMERLRRKADFAGFNASKMLRSGDPVQQLVRAAEEWAADLIVIGDRSSRRGSTWWSIPMPSQIRTLTKCPVCSIP